MTIDIILILYYKKKGYSFFGRGDEGRVGRGGGISAGARVAAGGDGGGGA